MTTHQIFVGKNIDKESLYKNGDISSKRNLLGGEVSAPQNPFPRVIWFAFLVIEVFLYGCYPLYVTLSKVNNEIKYSTASAVLLIEFGKLVFSLINIYPLWKRGQVERQPLIVWLAFSVPALLYCFNNNVAILVQRYLDPASYVIVSNLKIPTTALLYRIFIKRPLTWMKWLAVCLLTLAGVLNSFGNLVSEDKLEDNANKIHVTVTGLVIMTVYCAVSAFAGIWTELIVKRQYEVSIHQQNCMLYAFGVLFNFLAIFTVEVKTSSNSPVEGDSSIFSKLNNLFHDYNIWVVAIVCSETCCGLIMSAVMKHASNITRLFITSTAMVVTTLLSYILFQFELNVFLLSALGLVIFALFLYNRN
ncbi:probable UDP-sugar transporter protein SLC35A4 [Dendronephthya gigantea]|uniref:probable UDP-sugar transporter protein SLC35A4 n=1 Tax=Dendronephthya gigantea TaxID=151771 RepID=UPI00106CB306|nr:probable UDP-sugar transporter protein SLC35A4 [Dendronephthya gigantea]